MKARGPVAVVLSPALSARGGAERVAAAASATLRSAGYRVVLAYPGDSVDLNAVGDYFGIDLRGVEPLLLDSVRRGFANLEELRILSEQRAWARRLKNLAPAVFFNCMTGSEMPALAPQSFYYVHFPHERSGSNVHGVRRAYVRMSAAARAVAFNRGRSFLTRYTILANSAFTAGHVRRLWGQTAEVLYPPVPDFGPGLAVRQPWIVSAGRFQERLTGHPHKRQDALIEAFSDLGDLHARGWQLHLVGSVGSPDELDRLRLIAEGSPVFFHPDATRPELAELYRSSSIYWHAQGFEEPEDLNPNAQEHFGLSVAEALSAGALPLVYDTAGPAEIVGSLPDSTRWRTLNDLVMKTRKMASEGREGLPERAHLARVAHGFSVEVFNERLSAMVGRGDVTDELSSCDGA